MPEILEKSKENLGSILIPRIFPKEKETVKIINKKHGNTRRSFRIKPIWLMILGVFLLLFFIIGILSFDTYKKGLILKSNVERLKDAGVSQDLVRINAELTTTKKSLSDFGGSYRRLYVFSAVPYFGNFYRDGIHGVNAAGYAIEASEILLKTIEPYADIIGLTGANLGVKSAEQNTQERIDFIIKTIPDLIPKADELSSKVLSIKKEIDRIDPQRYPEKFRGREIRSNLVQAVDIFNEGARFVENSKPLLTALPYMLGVDGERTYLVLFQNDKELRPTGGFLTAYSIAKVSKGRFEPGVSSDIYSLDNSYKPHMDSPEPFAKYLKGIYINNPKYRLRDLNWSPDFSQSMEVFLKEAKTAGLPEVDGVIAVDTQVLVNILNVIGPIGVSDFGNFSTEIIPECKCPQVIYELENFADQEGAVVWSENEPGKIVFAPKNYGQNRKRIIGPLMNSILANALGQPKEKLPDLFNAGFKSLAEKHILVYMLNKNAQTAVANFGIGGTMNSTESDYLSIIDANLGGRKSNLYVKTDIHQDINIAKDGSVIKKITITYKNSEKQDGWLNSILPNWVRVYVPKGSELISFDGVEDKQKPYEEFGKTVFAGHFELRPQGVAKVTLEYKLPMKMKSEYELLIQKQPGKDTSIYSFNIDKREEEIYISSDKEVKFKI